MADDLIWPKKVYIALEPVGDYSGATDIIGVYATSDGARKGCAMRAGEHLLWTGGENFAKGVKAGSCEEGFLVMSTEVRP